MKAILMFLALSAFNFTYVSAQTIKSEETKMDQFASKTGAIIKFTDFNLSKIKLFIGAAESKVRKVQSNNEAKYFYQISYDKSKAAIAYEDLIEILKALEILKKESIQDLSNSPDYLENKFITDDSVQLGYYVSKGKINWYLVLEKYNSGNTIFFKNISDLELALNNGRSKIEYLQSN